MGVAIIRVNTMIYSVFTMFPAIPVVPCNALVTVVKKFQLMHGTPLIKTYAIIPTNRITEKKAAR